MRFLFLFTGVTDLGYSMTESKDASYTTAYQSATTDNTATDAYAACK